MIEYTNHMMTYSAQGQKITSDCISITFFNASQNIILINQSLPVVPNTSITFSGNQFEIDRTQYEVTFNVLDITNGQAKCVVVRKNYKNQQTDAAGFAAVYRNVKKS